MNKGYYQKMHEIDARLRERLGHAPSIPTVEAERDREIYLRWLSHTAKGIGKREKMDIIARIAEEMGMDFSNAVNMVYKIVRKEERKDMEGGER